MIRPGTLHYHKSRHRVKAILATSTNIQIFSTSPSPQEIDSILKLQAICWDPQMRDTRNDIKNLFNNPNWLTLLARDIAQRVMVIGFCAGHLIGRSLHIYVCEIHPNYRRQGLARYLIRTLIYLGSLRNAQSCTVHVINPHLKRFFKEIGFKSVGLRQIHHIMALKMHAKIAEII